MTLALYLACTAVNLCGGSLSEHTHGFSKPTVLHTLLQWSRPSLCAEMEHRRRQKPAVSPTHRVSLNDSWSSATTSRRNGFIGEGVCDLLNGGVT
jgi:hypothetical protein